MSKISPASTNIKPEKAATARKRGKKIPKKITETYLHNAGLYYLQRFSASAGHFRSVMMRKVRKSCAAHPEQDPAECAAMVDRLVEKFTSAGLLNDEIYARGMVSSLRRQGKSKRNILLKLAVKGLDAETAQTKLAEFDTEEGEGSAQAELAAAATFARKKKLGPYARPGTEDRRQKDFAAMARAGFSYDVAQKILGGTVDEDL